jgi:2-polyprenyl-3-methyl-5-hydroxy-6-metoxy-1,4-benzoquinol methylase
VSQSTRQRTPASTPTGLSYQPLPAFRPGPLLDDAAVASCQGKRVGVLIVTRNAVSTLVPVLKRITPNVWQNVEEVVVFDDASDDATFELAVGLKALRDLPKLNVLRHPTNLGYGGNQKEGYRYFLDRGFDVVVLLHGDGKYAPEILARMYEPIVTGRADAVFGSRMMPGYGGAIRCGMPIHRYLANRLLTFVENRALGLTLTEGHSGYRAYDLHAIARLDLSSMTDDFHFDTEIIIKLHHQGFRILEVPIPTYYGSEIQYVNGLKYSLNVLRALRRYRQACRSVRRAPEFREYFVHYPVKQMRHSSHGFARRLVGTNQDVLDVACGEGFLAAELRANGNRVTGVDALAEPAKPEAFDDYVSHSIRDDFRGVLHALGGRTFDRMLFLDVLEHLEDPDRVLRECLPALKPSGLLIVSVPNMANLTIRLGLLMGRFNYTERGLLDRTHRHFYTWKTARRLLEDAGWVVEQQQPTVMPIELVMGLAPTNLVMRVASAVLATATKVLPRLLGYQVLLVARPRRTDGDEAYAAPNSTLRRR